MNKLAEQPALRDDPLMASHPLDAMTAAPDHHRILFENDKVRVLDTKVPAGERTPVHAHEWPAALYVLSWSDFIRRDAEGAVLVDSRDRPRPEPGEDRVAVQDRVLHHGVGADADEAAVRVELTLHPLRAAA